MQSFDWQGRMKMQNAALITTGKYFEELEVGDKFFHPDKNNPIIISQELNIDFCEMTMNTQRIHFDNEFAVEHGFKGAIVNSFLTLSLVVGVTVEGLSDGTIFGNLSYDKINYPRAVYAGDNLLVETEVISCFQ